MRDGQEAYTVALPTVHLTPSDAVLFKLAHIAVG
jgi:hypothetical protein